MTWSKYCRLVLILIPVMALLYFGFNYINPSGQLTVEYDFCQKETPYFSGLSPQGRVLELQNFDFKFMNEPQRCYQKMIIDPVYFDVRLPQSYQAVQIEVLMDTPSGQLVQFGSGVNPSAWVWDFDSGTRHQESGIMVYNSDLTQARFANNRYRFIISAPGLADSGPAIVFYNLKMSFKKEPLSWQNVGQRIRSLVNF